MDLLLLSLVVITWLAVGATRLPTGSPFKWAPGALAAAAWFVLGAGWATELRLQVRGLLAVPLLEPLVNREVPDTPPPPLPATPAERLRLDLLASPPPPAVTVDGMLPAAGPLPAWRLPRVRGEDRTNARLAFPVPVGVDRLRIAFSVRLHQRNRAGLSVRLNGAVVDTLRLTGAGRWTDRVLELTPRPGVNVLEFRDTELCNEPDWEDYLARYQDVTRHLIVNNLPLDEGAREHYEVAGKAEGRTVRLIPRLPIESDAYRFLFRQLVIAGDAAP